MRGSPPASQQFVSTNQLLTPEKAQKATERARDALLRGRYEEAQKQVTRALEICPNCAIALTLQGIMKIEGKNYAEAAQTFRQAINADPTLGVAYLGLGQAYNSLAVSKRHSLRWHAWMQSCLPHGPLIVRPRWLTWASENLRPLCRTLRVPSESEELIGRADQHFVSASDCTPANE